MEQQSELWEFAEFWEKIFLLRQDIEITRKVYNQVKDVPDAKNWKQATKIRIELENKINKNSLGEMFFLYELELKELAHKGYYGSPCYKLGDFNYTLHCLIRSIRETIIVKTELLYS